MKKAEVQSKVQAFNQALSGISFDASDGGLSSAVSDLASAWNTAGGSSATGAMQSQANTIINGLQDIQAAVNSLKSCTMSVSFTNVSFGPEDKKPKQT